MVEREIVNTIVTVRGIVADDPPLLSFEQRLKGLNGTEKLHSQWVAILDAALLRRLEHEVVPGDEIAVTLASDWTDDDYATSLLDFSLSPPADDRSVDLPASDAPPAAVRTEERTNDRKTKAHR